MVRVSKGSSFSSENYSIKINEALGGRFHFELLGVAWICSKVSNSIKTNRLLCPISTFCPSCPGCPFLPLTPLEPCKQR